MSFLQDTNEVAGTLVHHTGTMLRFTTSQLPLLPPAASAVQVIVPDGRAFDCHFNPNPGNPNVVGAAFVHWLKLWVPEGKTETVRVVQRGAGSSVQLLPNAHSGELAAVLDAATTASVAADADQRRKNYSRFERNPQLRSLALNAWGVDCQVVGCSMANEFPESHRARLVDVHHLNHVSQSGSDHPLNVCVVCVGHHAIIHRAPDSLVVSCDSGSARIQVNGDHLEIERDMRQVW